MSTANSLSRWVHPFIIPIILCWSLALSAQQGEILTDTDLPELPATALEVIDGTVYCGTSHGGFYSIESATNFQFHNTPVTGVLGYIVDFTPYRDQVAICFHSGSQLKVYLYNPSNDMFTEIINKDSIIPNMEGVDYFHANPYAMDANDSTILIGSSAGLVMYQNNKTIHYTCLVHVPELPNCWDTIYDVKIIGKKAWLAQNGQITSFRPDTSSTIPRFSPTPLPSNSNSNKVRVNTLAPEMEEVVYLTTSDNLLMKYDHGDFDTLAAGDSNIAYRDVRESKWLDGTLWMVSEDGLFTYDGQSTAQVVPLNSGCCLDVTDCIKVAGGDSEVWYSSCLVNNTSTAQNRTAFEIYPNPVEDQLHLKSTESLNSDLYFKLTELNGQTALRHLLSPGQTEWHISVQEIDPGYYLGQFINDHGEHIRSKAVIITR